METCTWQFKESHKEETEFLLLAAQYNAIRTNYLKTKIDNTLQNSKCRLRGDEDETINHVSECCELA